MDELKHRWREGRMEGRIESRWMEGRMDELKGRWMKRRMDGRIDG
jgi:hypothetical protein